MSSTSLKVAPNGPSPNGSGYWNTRDTIVFVVPPLANTAIESIAVVGHGRIAARQTVVSVPLDCASAQMIFGFDPTCGYLGFFSRSEVWKAFSLNPLDGITLMPNIISMISRTRHASDFVSTNFGTGLDPVVRYTAGRTRGSVIRANDSNEKYCVYFPLREFFFRPPNSIFSQALDLGLTNGINFQLVVAAPSDSLEFWGKLNVDATAPPRAQLPTLTVPKATNLTLEITDIALLLKLKSVKSPNTTFTQTSIDLTYQDRPNADYVSLSIPFQQRLVRAIDTFIMPSYSNGNLAFSNLSTIASQRSDYQVTRDGVRQKFTYNTRQISEELRICDGTTNTYYYGSLQGVSRSATVRQIARGAFFELIYNFSSVGTLFQSEILQFSWVSRPKFTPLRSISTNFVTASTQRQEEIHPVNIKAHNAYQCAPGGTTMDPSEANAKPASTDITFVASEFKAIQPKSNEDLQLDVYGGCKVVTAVTSISTLAINSQTSEVTPVGPPQNIVPVDLISSEVAPITPVNRVVKTEVVGTIIPYSDINVDWVDFTFPDTGLMPAKVLMRFRLKFENTALVAPGSTFTGTTASGVTSLLLNTSDVKAFSAFNRLTYPVAVGSCSHFRHFIHTLPNGVSIRREEIAHTKFLDLYGHATTTSPATTSFTNRRADRFVKSSTGSMYHDWQINRTQDKAVRCYDAVCPYALGSVATANGVTAKWTDYRYGPKNYCIDLMSSDAFMQQLANVPNLTTERRTIRVGIDQRGLFSYSPCGGGNEIFGSMEKFYYFNYNDDREVASPRCTLDRTYVPRLVISTVYLKSSAQTAVMNSFAAQGTTISVPQYERYYDNLDTASVPTSKVLDIGGYNPSAILTCYNNLRYDARDVDYIPVSNNPTAKRRSGMCGFISSRDGPLCCSMSGSVVKCATSSMEEQIKVGAVDPLIDIYVDNELVNSYPQGSAAVNAWNFTTITGKPLSYPDFLVSDKSQSLVERPASTIPAPKNVKATVNSAQVSAAVFYKVGSTGTYNPTVVGTFEDGISKYVWPSGFTFQASRNMLMIDIQQQFRNGARLELRQRNAGNCWNNFFGCQEMQASATDSLEEVTLDEDDTPPDCDDAKVGAMPTAPTPAQAYLPNMLLRTTILKTQLSITLFPQSASLAYLYPTGDFTQ